MKKILHLFASLGVALAGFSAHAQSRAVAPPWNEQGERQFLYVSYDNELIRFQICKQKKDDIMSASTQGNCENLGHPVGYRLEQIARTVSILESQNTAEFLTDSLSVFAAVLVGGFFGGIGGGLAHRAHNLGSSTLGAATTGAVLGGGGLGIAAYFILGGNPDALGLSTLQGVVNKDPSTASVTVTADEYKQLITSLSRILMETY